MICKKCGRELNEKVQICGGCGTPTTISINEIVKENPTNNLQPKKGKIKIVPIIIIIVALILIGLGTLAYLTKTNDSQTIFNYSINKVYSSLERMLESGHKTVKGTMTLVIDTTTFGADQNLIDIINGIELSADYGIDYENKIMNFDIGTTYNNNELLNANVYGANEALYIQLEDIFDKYIQVPMESYSSMFEQADVAEYKTIISSVKEAIITSLSSDYFTSQKATITVNEESVVTTKSTLKLNERQMYTFIKSVVKALSADNEFVTAYASLLEIDVTDVKTMLDENSLIEPTEAYDNAQLEISIYTKGITNDLVKVAVNATNEEDESNLSFEFTKTSANTYLLELNTDGQVLAGSIVTSKVEGIDTYEISLVSGEESITLKFGFSAEYDAIIGTKNVSNNVTYEDMTEDDIMTIRNNLMENEGLGDLYMELMSLSTY